MDLQHPNIEDTPKQKEQRRTAEREYILECINNLTCLPLELMTADSVRNHAVELLKITPTPKKKFYRGRGEHSVIELEEMVQTLEIENEKIQDSLQTRDASIEVLMGRLEIKNTGWDEHHMAWRYSQIHECVEKMGGWANYRHWALKHSDSHFNLLSVLERENERLDKRFELFAKTITHPDQDLLIESQKRIVVLEEIVSDYQTIVTRMSRIGKVIEMTYEGENKRNTERYNNLIKVCDEMVATLDKIQSHATYSADSSGVVESLKIIENELATLLPKLHTIKDQLEMGKLHNGQITRS